jgi:hypothetical protein
MFSGVWPVVLLGDYLDVAARNPDAPEMPFRLQAGFYGWHCVLRTDLVVAAWLGYAADGRLLLVQTLTSEDGTAGGWGHPFYRLPAIQMFESLCTRYAGAGLTFGPIGLGGSTGYSPAQIKQVADDFIRGGARYLQPHEIA